MAVTVFIILKEGFVRKNLFAMLAFSLSVGAHAIETPSGADATALRLSPSGVGHVLMVPYYSTQNGNATLLSLLNTDEVNGKVVKLRFRGALNGDNVYDLQIFLAPGDMWTANVSRNAQGVSFLTTEDNSCTKPGGQMVNGTPFQTERLNPSDSEAERANGTREGYVEIITLADVPASTTGMYPLMALKDGKAICADAGGNTSWSALSKDLANEAAYAAHGLKPPTTGMSANWTIMNVPKALSWSGAATALEAHKDGVPAKGNLVYFPQTNEATLESHRFSADPLYAGETPAILPAFFDLPDLSTPYIVGADTAAAQADVVGDTLAARKLLNEFWTEPSILAETDWQLTMPTRRFALGVNYQTQRAPNLVRNSEVQKHFSTARVSLIGNTLCILSPSHVPRSRNSEKPVDPDGVVMGGVVWPRWLNCGVVSIQSINNPESVSRVLSADVALTYVDALFTNGWMRVDLAESDNSSGIPVIGNAFVQAMNPAIAPGTAGNFGVTWSHRFIQD